MEVEGTFLVHLEGLAGEVGTFLVHLAGLAGEVGTFLVHLAGLEVLEASYQEEEAACPSVVVEDPFLVGVAVPCLEVEVESPLGEVEDCLEEVEAPEEEAGLPLEEVVVTLGAEEAIPLEAVVNFPVVVAACP